MMEKAPASLEKILATFLSARHVLWKEQDLYFRLRWKDTRKVEANE